MTGEVELAGVRVTNDVEERVKAPVSAIRSNLVLVVMFASWFFIDAIYNISNKEVLQKVHLEWSLTLLHFMLGGIYYIAMWLLRFRAMPILSKRDIINLLPLAICQVLTHLGSVVSLYFGTVSFVHIVKSAEPLPSAILSILIMRERYPMAVYLSFIPVIAGISLASFHEDKFAFIALVCALVAMLASSVRSIYSKKVLQGRVVASNNMTPSNLYGTLTIMSFFILLIPTMIIEPPTVYAAQFEIAMGKGVHLIGWPVWALISAVTYTWFNEIAFICLDQISPVTYAVANTSKRTVIIVASVLWLKNSMQPLGWVGGAIALAGVLSYSLAKLHFKPIKLSSSHFTTSAK